VEVGDPDGEVGGGKLGRVVTDPSDDVGPGWDPGPAFWSVV
jgi:hypothetical protein